MTQARENFLQVLKSRLECCPDLESKLDELRQYKKEVSDLIYQTWTSHPLHLQRTMLDLSELADAILEETYCLARNELKPVYGDPYSATGAKSEWAIIGMGKLGGREMHFGSDLDLIFVYDHNGETRGAKTISNKEYFAKLAQRLISYLSLPTRKGFAYKVDTELRPSGNQGALVTSLDAWISYYQENAQLWERQAMLRARLIYAGGQFARSFSSLFRKLIFSSPFPSDLGDEMNHLRQRIEVELAKETATKWHYKKGYGGLIEFAVQYLQLRLGATQESLLTPNTVEAIDGLDKVQAWPSNDLGVFREAYFFYRRLEIYLEQEFSLKEGYLDLDHSSLSELSSRMGYESASRMIETWTRYRQEVRRIYLAILQNRVNP
jgi:[glutamine synthetase] adenylyltransferase / [glutamine synthetase]-adenylyl-L-tyrosine phosphorylase